MESVFIVEACVHYEGSSPIRAFATADDANDFARYCTEYQATRPEFPGDTSTEAEIAQWAAADKAWGAAHPAGDHTSSDYFNVVNVPFGAIISGSADAHETMAKQPAITEADVRAAQANAIQGFVDACKDAGVIGDAVVSVAAQCIAAIRGGAPKDKAVTHEAEALGDKGDA